MASFRQGRHVTCPKCGHEAYLSVKESFVDNDKMCDCKGMKFVRMIHNPVDPIEKACCDECQEERKKPIRKRKPCPCKDKKPANNEEN